MQEYSVDLFLCVIIPAVSLSPSSLSVFPLNLCHDFKYVSRIPTHFQSDGLLGLDDAHICPLSKSSVRGLENIWAHTHPPFQQVIFFVRSSDKNSMHRV